MKKESLSFSEYIEVEKLTEKSLGSKVEFDTYESWVSSLPKGHQLFRTKHEESAQATSKDFQGRVGVWNKDKNNGWIYSHYLNKDNLRESI